MRRIVISDDVESITLLRDLEFDTTPQPIEHETEMASGRTVADVVGYKDFLNLPVGWLSVEDHRKLCGMIKRNHGILTISYETPEGERTEKFKFQSPTWTAFDYDDNGVAVWKGVTLVGKTVEVVR